jgi:pimeloyl-ACP methyl ester carboxylesterase
MEAHANDTVINFEIEGPKGAPVVTFSHSLRATLDMWELQVLALRDSYRVLRFDTRGGAVESRDFPCSSDTGT